MSNASHDTASGAPQHAASADKADAAVELHVQNNTATPETGTQLADSRDLQTPDVDNSAPTKRTKLVIWAVGGMLIVCFIVLVAWHMRRQVPVKPSARRILPGSLARQSSGPDGDSKNNAHNDQTLENIPPKNTELDTLNSKNKSSLLATETPLGVVGACKDYTLEICFVKQALEWNNRLFKINNNDMESFWYKIKPFAITPSVFCPRRLSDESKNGLDYGFAVNDALYSLNQKADYYLFVGESKSNFEWKHFYTFYSILEKVPEPTDNLTWIDLFGLEETAKIFDACILSIVQQLFGCKKNGLEVKGNDMILAVLESDLYNVIVTMFAKAAEIFANQLYVNSKSMTKIYYAWFHDQNGIRLPKSNFGHFIFTFISNIIEYLSFLNCQVLADFAKNPNLKTVLHVTLIFSSYTFDISSGMSSTIVDKIKGNVTVEHGEVKFADLFTNIRNDVPCWPGTDEPILPDLNEEISFKNKNAVI